MKAINNKKSLVPTRMFDYLVGWNTVNESLSIQKLFQKKEVIELTGAEFMELFTYATNSDINNFSKFIKN